MTGKGDKVDRAGVLQLGDIRGPKNPIAIVYIHVQVLSPATLNEKGETEVGVFKLVPDEDNNYSIAQPVKVMFLFVLLFVITNFRLPG